MTTPNNEHAYTPTTLEVRSRWVAFDPKPFSAGGTASDEFDRWLSVHDAEVRAAALEDAAKEAEGEIPRTSHYPRADAAAYIRALGVSAQKQEEGS